MNEEEKARQTWQTPVIIDLDLNTTSGGKNAHTDETSSATGPS